MTQVNERVFPLSKADDVRYTKFKSGRTTRAGTRTGSIMGNRDTEATEALELSSQVPSVTLAGKISQMTVIDTKSRNLVTAGGAEAKTLDGSIIDNRKMLRTQQGNRSRTKRNSMLTENTFAASNRGSSTIEVATVPETSVRESLR